MVRHTVYTNLFFVVEPVPTREIYVNTYEESCLGNAPPSLCIPGGIVRDGSGKNGWLLTKAEPRMEAQNVSAEISGPWIEDNHISGQHLCKDANHMCGRRNGCFARPALSGISCHQNSGAPVDIPNTEIMDLCRLCGPLLSAAATLAQSRAPCSAARAAQFCTWEERNFPLPQSHLRFCNKAFLRFLRHRSEGSSPADAEHFQSVT